MDVMLGRTRARAKLLSGATYKAPVANLTLCVEQPHLTGRLVRVKTETGSAGTKVRYSYLPS